ncbi:MAG TPA: hypothetical protein VL287_00390, partial [Gemmatimonadales bacterium]|nr:hypothetical protein [Gemmatimonadales bacterium]
MALPGTHRLSAGSRAPARRRTLLAIGTAAWLAAEFAGPVPQASAQDSAVAQYGRAVVVRNVNLRPTPSTAVHRIRLLHPPDEMGLREDTTTRGFYPVVTEEDEVGWVWARNIHRVTDTT